MRNEFTAVIEREGDWYIGYCPEVTGANGQGRTVEECKISLAEAIALIAFDTLQCSRVRLVENDAHNSVQEGRSVIETLKDHALTCFSLLDDDDETVAVPRDHLVVNDCSHRGRLDDHQVIGFARRID